MSTSDSRELMLRPNPESTLQIKAGSPLENKKNCRDQRHAVDKCYDPSQPTCYRGPCHYERALSNVPVAVALATFDCHWSREQYLSKVRWLYPWRRWSPKRRPRLIPLNCYPNSPYLIRRLCWSPYQPVRPPSFCRCSSG